MRNLHGDDSDADPDVLTGRGSSTRPAAELERRYPHRETRVSGVWRASQSLGVITPRQLRYGRLSKLSMAATMPRRMSIQQGWAGHEDDSGPQPFAERCLERSAHMSRPLRDKPHQLASD